MSKRSISCAGAVATIVGFVVGVSIFVLPGTLAGSVGPGIVATYLIASVLGLFSCVAAAQVGVCYPVTGASFVAVADLLGELWAFLLVWFLVGAGSIGITLLAFGLADYLGSLIALDRRLVAFLSIGILTLVNLKGADVSVRAQWVFVVAFLAALALFILRGIVNIDTQNLRPFLVNGWSPVLLAVLPAYFSYSGFLVISELAGEIRDPARTIPRALLISFLIVVVTYTLVAVVLVGVSPWTELSGQSAPVSSVASLILPEVAVSAITLASVAAAASSINGVLLGYSRDVRALANRGMLPKAGLLHAKWMHPDAAGVVPIALIAFVAAAVGSGIESLAILAVTGVLLSQCLLGLALVRLPTHRPERYLKAGFRFPKPVLAFFAWGLVVTSLIACAAIVGTSSSQAMITAAFCVCGVLIYRQTQRPNGAQRTIITISEKT